MSPSSVLTHRVFGWKGLEGFGVIHRFGGDSVGGGVALWGFAVICEIAQVVWSFTVRNRKESLECPENLVKPSL